MAFANFARTLAARIRPIGAVLIPGASARVDIVTASAPNATVVPESAIVKDPDTGAPEVFVPGGKPGMYRRVPVRIILQSGSRVAVAASALHEGGKVVSQGAYGLLPFAGGFAVRAPSFGRMHKIGVNDDRLRWYSRSIPKAK